MKERQFKAIAAMACGLFFVAASASNQAQSPATQGPAENGSIAWHLAGSFPDPGGRTVVDAEGNVTKYKARIMAKR